MPPWILFSQALAARIFGVWWILIKSRNLCKADFLSAYVSQDKVCVLNSSVPLWAKRAYSNDHFSKCFVYMRNTYDDMAPATLQEMKSSSALAYIISCCQIGKSLSTPSFGTARAHHVTRTGSRVNVPACTPYTVALVIRINRCGHQFTMPH